MNPETTKPVQTLDIDALKALLPEADYEIHFRWIPGPPDLGMVSVMHRDWWMELPLSARYADELTLVSDIILKQERRDRAPLTR